MWTLSWCTGVGSGGGKGGTCPPLFCLGGQWYVCAPPLFTPHFNFSLELYVYIKLTNNYLAFFIYQLIILWTISINWHRWLLVNNHISKYNSFILVLYRRYINYVSVCPPTFWHLPTPLLVVCGFTRKPSSSGGNPMWSISGVFSELEKGGTWQ